MSWPLASSCHCGLHLFLITLMVLRDSSQLFQPCPSTWTCPMFSHIAASFITSVKDAAVSAICHRWHGPWSPWVRWLSSSFIVQLLIFHPHFYSWEGIALLLHLRHARKSSSDSSELSRTDFCCRTFTHLYRYGPADIYFLLWVISTIVFGLPTLFQCLPLRVPWVASCVTLASIVPFVRGLPYFPVLIRCWRLV